MLKRIFLFTLLTILLQGQVAHAARYALVIGNGDYKSSPLKNSVNDANDIATTLQRLNFNVSKIIDANQKDMYWAIREFGQRLDEDDVGLFYFAGHGMQVKGTNYLIPVGSEIEAEDEVQFRAIDTAMVLAKMESAGNNLNIIILDACRNNPFARSFRSSYRGLARMDAPMGSMLVYATAPGSVAADGDGGNGLFTHSLLNYIEKPNLSLEEVIRQTRADVVKSSDRRQVPWSSSSMLEAFYFVPKLVADTTNNASPKLDGLSTAELSSWQEIKQCNDITKVRLFVIDYPNGTFTPVVKNCLIQLEQAQEAEQTLSLYVDTSPAEANVRVLNIKPKYEYGIKLKSGRYHIEVSQQGYQKKKQWVELSQAKQEFDFQLDKLRTTSTSTELAKDNAYTVDSAISTMNATSLSSFMMGRNNGDSHEKPVYNRQISPEANMLNSEFFFDRNNSDFNRGSLRNTR